MTVWISAGELKVSVGSSFSQSQRQEELSQQGAAIFSFPTSITIDFLGKLANIAYGDHMIVECTCHRCKDCKHPYCNHVTLGVLAGVLYKM